MPIKVSKNGLDIRRVEVEDFQGDVLWGDAWKWFISKSPEDRSTAIIRAWQDREAWEGDLE